jgi:DNA-binding response OmpR family regulator
MSANEGKKDYRFLIVDDQPQMLIHLTGMLKAGGYKKIACADTAREALGIIKRYPVDFIIADWHMSNMTGIELLTVIRKNPTYCDIPFLMITGEMTQEKVVYALEEGVDGYLIKPISQSQVITAVRNILHEKSHPGSTRLAQETLKKDENPEVLLALSECYLHKKDYKNATKYAQKVLKIKRDSRALHLLGKIYMAQEKYEEAIEYLYQSSEINPLNLSRKIEIGKVYLKLGLRDEAAETFHTVEESETTDLNRVDMGAAYLSHGHVTKAGEYLEQAADPIPETVVVFNKYAIELRKFGQHKESLKQYKKCLKIEPESYILHYNLGRAYFEMEQHREARKALEDSLRLKPDHEKTRKLLAYVKSKSDR